MAESIEGAVIYNPDLPKSSTNHPSERASDINPETGETDVEWNEEDMSRGIANRIEFAKKGQFIQFREGTEDLLCSLEGREVFPDVSGVTGKRRYLVYSALIQEDDAAGIY